MAQEEPKKKGAPILPGKFLLIWKEREQGRRTQNAMPGCLFSSSCREGTQREREDRETVCVCTYKTKFWVGGTARKGKKKKKRQAEVKSAQVGILGARRVHSKLVVTRRSEGGAFNVVSEVSFGATHEGPLQGGPPGTAARRLGHYGALPCGALCWGPSGV